MRGERRFGNGIKTDCEILLNEFVKTENVRYEDFANIWHSMNFSFVYFGLKHQVDQRDFTEEAFEVASNFLMPPFTFQVRIGALYLLYGLYFTQIQNPKIKIHMSLNRWQELIGLHEDIHKQQHLDAEYVFLKLKVERAFMITATPKCMFYRRTFGKSEPDTAAHMRQPHSILAEYIDNDSLENLEVVHSKYEYLKSKLKGREDQSLKIVKESMSVFINSNIQEFLDQQSLACGQTSEDGNEQSDPDDEEQLQMTAAHERALRIAKIKAKSFAGGVLHHASKQDVGSTTKTEDVPCTSKEAQANQESKTNINIPYVDTNECVLSMPTLRGDEEKEGSSQVKPKPKRGRPRKRKEDSSIAKEVYNVQKKETSKMKKRKKTQKTN
ncbi:snRNA-activating protein complex subunit 1-like isoform X2 [Anneissia japonica]|uniref:snRNA-activating protein complex subunit 1-like isoform X2 n=1 Tax=Anneissia japonica TaxID=1529436 RepID=UPI0014256C40|nr:snRNA-activating protein complex subunit 1-like isoform X2 [Anneissia japonica]